MGTPRDARRERLVALLVLGIGAVLLLTSPTWFGSGRTGVGVGQLVLAVALLGSGALLLRRSRAR
jgi:Na+/phosphate symporter